MIVLTRSELQELTNKERAGAQAKVLAAIGVPFTRRPPAGVPLTTRRRCSRRQARIASLVVWICRGHGASLRRCSMLVA